MSSHPPLPPGFTLDTPQAAATPPLPPGFTLDQPSMRPDAFAGDDLLSSESMSRLAVPEPTAAAPIAPTATAPRPGGLITPFAPLGNLIAGAAEAGASLLTGAAAPIIASAKKIPAAFGNPDVAAPTNEEIAEHVYQPRGEVGRKLLGAIGKVTAPVAEAVQATGADVALLPLSAELQSLGAGARSARQMKPAPATTAQQVMDRVAPADSAGASASALRVTNAPADLQKAIVDTARRTGGAVNPESVRRHLEAETLPVPLRLTEGQALQEPGLISKEMNLRGKEKAYRDRFDEQNKALAENVRAVRERAGPDVFSTNAAEHGDTLINAYRAMDEARRADIGAKYKALADANGGNLPVNGTAFVNAAAAGLRKQMKAPFLPGPIKQILVSVRNGQPMTIESFENLRTALAAEARKADRAGDGNAAGAVSIVRDALESVPVEGASGNVKALADVARKAARERFQAIDADPAYKAIVNDKVTPDDFVRKFVIGGKRDNIEKLLANIGTDESARQTLSVATLDHLREAAALNPNYEGNFAAARFNKALTNLSPKLRHLMSPADIETLEQLGRVSRDVTFQPRGSFVNNSNTYVSAAADAAAGSLEGAANVAAGGIPIGTWGRKAVTQLQSRGEAKRALAPGAGIGVLRNRVDQLAGGQ